MRKCLVCSLDNLYSIFNGVLCVARSGISVLLYILTFIVYTVTAVIQIIVEAFRIQRWIRN